jgi:hypothetical protein
MSFERRSRSPRAVPVKPNIQASDLQLRTGPVIPDSPADTDGVSRYPFIVIRLGSAVYQAEKVKVQVGAPAASVRNNNSFLQHPSPYKSGGQIKNEAKSVLLAEVRVAVERTGLRMCIVWGPAWCSFVETDGSIKASFDPPSGGVR